MVLFMNVCDDGYTAETIPSAARRVVDSNRCELCVLTHSQK